MSKVMELLVAKKVLEKDIALATKRIIEFDATIEEAVHQRDLQMEGRGILKEKLSVLLEEVKKYKEG